MKRLLFAALLLMPSDSMSLTSLQFQKGFLKWSVRQQPRMTEEESRLLAKAIWHGSASRLDIACTLAGMCVKESSLLVRRYHPDVLQRSDYLGCKYRTLWVFLKRMGLIKSKEFDLKDPEWLQWKKTFAERPDIGTMVACLGFSKLAGKFGLEKAVMIWKEGGDGAFDGGVNEIAARSYLIDVQVLREGLLKILKENER